jgi:hypothetical protein
VDRGAGASVGLLYLPFRDGQGGWGVALDGGAPDLVLARAVVTLVEKAVAGLEQAICSGGEGGQRAGEGRDVPKAQ